MTPENLARASVLGVLNSLADAIDVLPCEQGIRRTRRSQTGCMGSRWRSSGLEAKHRSCL